MAATLQPCKNKSHFSLMQPANPKAAKHHTDPQKKNLMEDYERENWRSLLGLQIKSIQSASGKPLLDESH